LACRKYSIPELKVETCDSKFQEDLEFGIANELFSNCSMAECVYGDLNHAFMWNGSDECYKVFFRGFQKECWEESNVYWTSGDLEAAMEDICSSKVPTSPPTVSPTETPTQIPSVTPTATPSLTPTGMPTVSPTTTPTINPTHVPTQLPSVPTETPTQWPSPSPTFRSHLPTTFAPTVTPTTKPTQSTLSPTFSVSLTTQISGITEAQIANTTAPLAKAVNISEELISIDRYSDVAILRRLMVSEFKIDYLIEVLERSDATEILEVI